MLQIKDIMTREVLRLTPETTIREAMEALSTNHLSGAPVVSGDTVVGVISMTDLLGFILSTPEQSLAAPGESIADSWDDPAMELSDEDDVQVMALSDGQWDEWTKGTDARVDDSSPEGQSLLSQCTVTEAMNEEVFSLRPGDSVKAAARMMAEKGIHRVLVMNDKTLVGIVSALDIARAVGLKGSQGSRLA